MHNELTKNDIKKMEDEIEYRVQVVRKQALEDVKEARAHGDLSENFEYHAAKKFKNQNESRIRYLQRTSTARSTVTPTTRLSFPMNRQKMKQGSIIRLKSIMKTMTRQKQLSWLQRCAAIRWKAISALNVRWERHCSDIRSVTVYS